VAISGAGDREDHGIVLRISQGNFEGNQIKEKNLWICAFRPGLSWMENSVDPMPERKVATVSIRALVNGKRMPQSFLVLDKKPGKRRGQAESNQSRSIGKRGNPTRSSADKENLPTAYASA